MALRRIGKELKDAIRDCADWLQVEPCEADMYHWICWLTPTGGIYAGLRFEVHINFPHDYPFKSLRATYESIIAHPSFSKGEPITSCGSRGSWSPALTAVSAILRPMLFLIDCPVTRRMLGSRSPPAHNRIADEAFDVATFVRSVRAFQPEDERLLAAGRSRDQRSEEVAIAIARQCMQRLRQQVATVNEDAAEMMREDDKKARAMGQVAGNPALAAAAAPVADAAMEHATTVDPTPMYLDIRALTGRSYPLQLTRGSSTEELMQRVARLIGMPDGPTPRLIFRAKLIRSGGILSDYLQPDAAAAAAPAGSAAANTATGATAVDPLTVHIVMRFGCSCFMSMMKVEPFRMRPMPAAAAAAATRVMVPATADIGAPATNSLQRLASVELQLIMRCCALRDLLSLASSCRLAHTAASHPFAWQLVSAFEARDWRNFDGVWK